MSKLQKFIRACLVVSMLVVAIGIATAQASLLPNELPEGFLYSLDGNSALVDTTVYVRSGDTWSEQAPLIPARVVEGWEGYGTASVIQGNTALVTSYGEDPHQPEPEDPDGPGSLFIFNRSGTTWSQAQELVFTDNFGLSVDIDGSRIIVTDPGQYDSYERVVRFVEFNGTTWAEVKNFVVGYGPGDSGSVAISGDLALSGAGDDGAPFTQVYKRVGGIWTIQTTLPAGVVDIDGNTAVINNSVYVTDGTNWTLQAMLIPDETVSNPVGNAAIEGNRIVISFGDKTFVFTRSGTTWTQQQKLTFNGADVAGIVAISGNLALVNNHTFDLDAAPPASQELLFNGDFEINVDGEPTVPDGWIRKNTTQDVRRCNQISQPSVAYSGQCTYFLKGGSGSGRKLIQNIDLSQFSLQAGDHLQLTGFYNKQSTGTVSVYVYITYVGGTEDQGRIQLTKTTSGYKAVNPIDLTLTGVPTRVRVVIENGTTSGKTWFDAMTLKKTSSNLIPLSSAPANNGLIPLP